MSSRAETTSIPNPYSSHAFVCSTAKVLTATPNRKPHRQSTTPYLTSLSPDLLPADMISIQTGSGDSQQLTSRCLCAAFRACNQGFWKQHNPRKLGRSSYEKTCSCRRQPSMPDKDTLFLSREISCYPHALYESGNPRKTLSSISSAILTDANSEQWAMAIYLGDLGYGTAKTSEKLEKTGSV